MKMITLHQRISINEVFKHIQHKLNILFAEQRQNNLHFIVRLNGDKVEITQPDIYAEDILFSIEVKDQELWITRSEHYVDDVNSLTVESILNELFSDVSGKWGTDLLQEG